MWGGKDSLRAAVWEVLKTEPEGLAAEDISRRVTDGDYKLGGGSGTSEVRCQHTASATKRSDLIRSSGPLAMCWLPGVTPHGQNADV